MNIYPKAVAVLHGEDKMVGRSRQRVCSHETDRLVRKTGLNTMITQITNIKYYLINILKVHGTILG